MIRKCTGESTCPSQTNGGRSNFPSAGPSTSKEISGRSTSPTTEIEAGSTSSAFVRPPSPVLPRRKSSGSGTLRNMSSASKRLNNTRRDSGCAGSITIPETLAEGKETVRKKSLTWCESDKQMESTSSIIDKRKGTKKSFDANGGQEM